MLKAYAADRYGAAGLDIAAFTGAFCKLREARGLPAGLYRPSRAPQAHDGPSGSINNPLLPGQSATATRAGVGRLGTRPPPPNGYSMPGEATSRDAKPRDAFQTLMEAAYMMDVLVGDHFERYGRRPQGQRDGDKVLDAAAFDKGVANLGIEDWGSRECANVFAWINEAHNASYGRGRSRE
jgi:hypothetical protein